MKDDIIARNRASRPDRPKTTASPVRVLFLSTENAARSPIAESVLRGLSRGTAVIASAGVAPVKEIHPMARVAVRNVFNGQIAHERPQGVDAWRAERFDVVFTLSEEAGNCQPAFLEAVPRVHWPLEDPAVATGTRYERQLAFDRVTRQLLKRLRGWWRCRPSTAPPTPTHPRRPARRPGAQARWRTRPNGDTPTLAVGYLGPMRGCVNMCAAFERSGFQVLCGDKYVRTPRSMSVVPDSVVVRVDGNQRPDGTVRPEFRALRRLRSEIGDRPLLMLVDRVPSLSEQQVLSDSGATLVQRKRQSAGHFAKALEAFVHRVPPRVNAPTVAVAYFGPRQRCTGMCAQFERSGFHVICGRAPDTLEVEPDGVIVRVDGDRRPDGEVRPEFRAVQTLRGSLGEVPILMLGDDVPSDREQEVLKRCDTTFLQRRSRSAGYLIKAVDDLVNHRLRS